MGNLQRSLAARWEGSLLGPRWRSLARRDRLALAGLASFVLLVGLYLLLWLPAQRGVQAAREAYEQQRALQAYLQAKAPLVRRLAANPQRHADPAHLQGLVTASAAEQGLAVERLDSDGDGSLQVSLQPAPFAQLLRWFAALEERGVRIAEAGLDRAEGNRVTARLVLRAGP